MPTDLRPKYDSCERRPRLLRRLSIAALLAAAVFAAWQLKLFAYLSPVRVNEILQASGPLAPLTLMALMAIAVVASPIPTLPLDIAAGIYFGPWWGTLYAAAGALIGAVTAFVIARSLGRNLVERVVGGHISFCATCSDRLLTRIVFLTRLIPAVSFDVVSYGAGLTKMSLSWFTLATFAGMLPLTFAYVSAGRLLIADRMLTIAGGILAMVVMLALPMAIERFNPFGLREAFRHQPPDGTAPVSGQEPRP